MPKRRILVKITDTIPIVRIRKNGFSLEPFVYGCQLYENGCRCSHSMDVYKNRGDINEDWHTWITVPKKN